MKRKFRQRQILNLLQTESEIGLAEVCVQIGASEATVRREFVQLVREGKAERTWGGIKRRENGSTMLVPVAFTERLDENLTEKRAIAEVAAMLLEDGDVVMIDGGTTTFQLCPFIALKPIRVITNSLVIAHEVDRLKGSQRGAEIHLTGGMLQPGSGVVAGRSAEEFLKRYHAKWAFISAAGVDAMAATNHNESVLESEQVMIAQSSKVALLIDHSKMGRRAMSELCPIGEIDAVITGNARRPRVCAERLQGRECVLSECPCTGSLESKIRFWITSGWHGANFAPS